MPRPLTFLFWNLNRKMLQAEVAALAQEHQADFVLTCDDVVSPALLLDALNTPMPARFSFLPTYARSRVQIYATISPDWVTPRFDNRQVTIRSIDVPGRTSFLLAGVHLPSKLHQSESSQSHSVHALAQNIVDVEAEAGHDRTVLIGDLNMNPFESGMVAANGLNAAMTRRLANRSRNRRQRGAFYNPFWSRMGDDSQGPPGTCYFARSEQVCYFWNSFDQVLLRPSLLSYFANEHLRVLTEANGESLLRDGVPYKSRFSDHLPIVFQLAV